MSDNFDKRDVGARVVWPNGAGNGVIATVYPDTAFPVDVKFEIPWREAFLSNGKLNEPFPHRSLYWIDANGSPTDVRPVVHPECDTLCVVWGRDERVEFRYADGNGGFWLEGKTSYTSRRSMNQWPNSRPATDREIREKRIIVEGIND